MLPQTDFELISDFQIQNQPSYTFKLNTLDDNIKGFVDDLQAVKQAIYLILNTQRYQYLIYDWNYGVEFDDLIGSEKNYAMVQIQSRITDALLQDDRIEAVVDFEFESNKKFITAYFVVKTIFGDIETQKVVDIWCLKTTRTKKF